MDNKIKNFKCVLVKKIGNWKLKIGKEDVSRNVQNVLFL